MSALPVLIRRLGKLVPIALTLLAGLLSNDAPAAPIPTPKPPYALLFIPKKDNRDETIRSRRYQKALVENRSVLQAALRSLKAEALPSTKKQDDPVGWLSQNLKTEYLDGTGVIRISLAAGSRREQALLVNAVARAYFQSEVLPSRQSNEQGLDDLHKRLAIHQALLKVVVGEEKKKVEFTIADIEDSIKQVKAELRAPPQLLELADVPPE